MGVSIGAPHGEGMLEVGDGQQISWRAVGNPRGRPAVALHGGPGSGTSPLYPSLVDLERFRVVLFDQRGCGRSTPHAGDPTTSLATNTTAHLIDDIELLRDHLDIDRWLVLGLSWGSTLGLAYAQQHPERVAALVLGMVATGTRREVEWITRDMGRFAPQAWERFRDGVPERDRDGNLADAYARLLESDDPRAREQAAIDWCTWEDTHVAVLDVYPTPRRFEHARGRLAFARLVTTTGDTPASSMVTGCCEMPSGWPASLARWSMAGSTSARRSTFRGSCTSAGQAVNSSSSTKAVTLEPTG